MTVLCGGMVSSNRRVLVRLPKTVAHEVKRLPASRSTSIRIILGLVEEIYNNFERGLRLRRDAFHAHLPKKSRSNLYRSSCLCTRDGILPAMPARVNNDEVTTRKNSLRDRFFFEFPRGINSSYVSNKKTGPKRPVLSRCTRNDCIVEPNRQLNFIQIRRFFLLNHQNIYK